MRAQFVGGISFAAKQRRLGVLLLGHLCLKADVRDPVRLFESHFGKFFLAIVEFAKDGFFNLVYEMHVHFFGRLLNVHYFHQRVAGKVFSVFPLVFFEHLLNVLSKLFRVLHGRKRVILRKLCFDHLQTENTRKVDHHRVAERVSIVNLHVAAKVVDFAEVFKRQFQVNLVTNNQGRQVVVCSRR